MVETDTIVAVNDRCFLDTESHTVAIQVERVTLSIFVEEFLDFFNSLQEVKDYLTSSEEYVIGMNMQGDMSEVILPKPNEEDCT